MHYLGLSSSDGGHTTHISLEKAHISGSAGKFCRLPRFYFLRLGVCDPQSRPLVLEICGLVKNVTLYKCSQESCEFRKWFLYHILTIYRIGYT